MDNGLLVQEPDHRSLVLYTNPDGYTVLARYDDERGEWHHGTKATYTWQQIVAKAVPGSVRVAPPESFATVRPLPAEPPNLAVVTAANGDGSLSTWQRQGRGWHRLVVEGAPLDWAEIVAGVDIGSLHLHKSGEVIA